MFWQFENTADNSIALVDDSTGRDLTYNELSDYCDKISARIQSSEKKLVFLFCDNSTNSITAYLSILRSGNAVFLANSAMDDSLKKNLITIYEPEIIFSINDLDFLTNYKQEAINEKISFYRKENFENNLTVHKDLAVLLSTSGTTGSPKLVRLSYKNIQSNAEAIAEYLDINESEKPITSLPISYSFGLSVINSHLQKCASIVCSNKSMVMRDFWNTFNQNKCTSFSGVPYSYQLLKRLKFDTMEIPTLKMMTQAGGRLSEELIEYFYESSLKKNIKFFVMYGQTEATARISYLQPEKLGEKTGSIGIPIPRGEIKIFYNGKEISNSGKVGELVYYGDNVMMGYAESRNDLTKGDELAGILHTGDLAFKDEDGFYFINGRMKRFIKLFGLRVNLDEIERLIENEYGCAAACFGNDDMLKVLLQSSNVNLADDVKRKIISTYKIHHSLVKVYCTDSIPITPSGKKDYNFIQNMELR